MLTLNLPQNYSLLQDAFIKNIEKIKKADFCTKVLSLNAAQFAEFQNELKSLTTDKKIPNKYQALYDACLESYASLQMAVELDTSEFAQTSAAKDAMLTYRIACRFLENQIVKALNFEVDDLEKTYKDLDTAREDFQNKQALATYALMTGLDGRVAPYDSKNDNKPGTPPVNENLLYVSDVVAFENEQRKKQEDAENASKERTRIEKEQEDMRRAAEESAKSKEKALALQKAEQDKRLKSNEEVRERNAAIAKEHADNDAKKKKDFLPSYKAAQSDPQSLKDRELLLIISEHVAENAKKYPHKILEIIAAGRKLENEIKLLMETREKITDQAHLKWVRDHCLSPRNITNLASSAIEEAIFAEERAQAEALRLAEIQRQEEEEQAKRQAECQQRPMMMW